MNKWEQELACGIHNGEELCKAIGYPEELADEIDAISKLFPMFITKYYLSLIDPSDPDDPIAKMCIPNKDELLATGSLDTSGERVNTKKEGLQHKYIPTALILSSNVCAMYCRYCFRKRLVGLSDEELNRQVDEAAAYVGSHPEINNVLITGGDSLMNSNKIIEKYMELFCSIDCLDFIRFGTRVPVTFPQRIYDDPELIELFRKYARKKTIYLVTHYNHPRELTEESLKAIHILQECGIQIRNQSVLLKGVNSNPETLGLLLRMLTANKIVPYYIFQCRPVKGVKDHFQVPLREAIKIVDNAKAMQNGLGKNVRFVMSHPKGKIEIIGELEPGKMIFKFHENKYAVDEARLFSAQVDSNIGWLDDNLLPIV